MYISRVEINFRERKNLKTLNHLGAYHDLVERSFPYEIQNNIRSRKLWRVDYLKGKQYLIILSESEPSAQVLESVGVEGTTITKSYDNYLNSLHNEQILRFRVVLNPVVSIKSSDSKRGRVVPHVTVAHQTRFLMERSMKNGFSLFENELHIVERGSEPIFKNGERIFLLKVAYEGILKITDVNQFRKMLTVGLGRKKAYGFGLMTVIPFSNEHV